MGEPQPPFDCNEHGLPPLPPMTEERFAHIARGLAHPARIRIIELFDGDRCHMAQEIVDESTLAQSTVSEHLRILRQAGILFARKDGPRTWYCMRRSVLRQYAEALEGLSSSPVSFKR